VLFDEFVGLGRWPFMPFFGGRQNDLGAERFEQPARSMLMLSGIVTMSLYRGRRR